LINPTGLDKKKHLCYAISVIHLLSGVPTLCAELCHIGLPQSVSQAVGKVVEEKFNGNLQIASASLLRLMRKIGTMDKRWENLDEDKDAEELLQEILLLVKDENTSTLEVDPASSHFCRGGLCTW